jgi:hypothetical protein
VVLGKTSEVACLLLERTVRTNLEEGKAHRDLNQTCNHIVPCPTKFKLFREISQAGETFLANLPASAIPTTQAECYPSAESRNQYKLDVGKNVTPREVSQLRRFSLEAQSGRRSCGLPNITE